MADAKDLATKAEEEMGGGGGGSSTTVSKLTTTIRPLRGGWVVVSSVVDENPQPVEWRVLAENFELIDLRQ